MMGGGEMETNDNKDYCRMIYLGVHFIGNCQALYIPDFWVNQSSEAR